MTPYGSRGRQSSAAEPASAGAGVADDIQAALEVAHHDEIGAGEEVGAPGAVEALLAAEVGVVAAEPDRLLRVADVEPREKATARWVSMTRLSHLPSRKALTR